MQGFFYPLCSYHRIVLPTSPSLPDVGHHHRAPLQLLQVDGRRARSHSSASPKVSSSSGLTSNGIGVA